MKNIKVIKSKSLSTYRQERFIIVDLDTGEIVDDAQGYGYKTVQGAYAAWSYKNRDKSKDAEKKQKEKRIRTWMKQHKSFISLMNQIAFEIQKGSWGENDKFDAKLVKKLLKENNLEIDFTVGELLKVWRKH